VNPWFRQEFEKAIREKLEPREQAILNGNVLDDKSYYKLVGIRAGLLAALDEFNAIYERLEENS